MLQCPQELQQYKHLVYLCPEQSSDQIFWLLNLHLQTGDGEPHERGNTPRSRQIVLMSWFVEGTVISWVLVSTKYFIKYLHNLVLTSVVGKLFLLTLARVCKVHWSNFIHLLLAPNIVVSSSADWLWLVLSESAFIAPSLELSGYEQLILCIVERNWGCRLYLFCKYHPTDKISQKYV